eukprot:GHVU01125560.1.p1 GENE.GHVU01125560.1~~GHVU01125560.1.p1  ORF type:complete len:407 (+),score=14.64 GHVU01125560.1:43-1263(+)
MMNFLPKLCVLSLTPFTLAHLGLHPGQPVYDARRWTLEDNNQATHGRFHLVRRQPLPEPYDESNRPGSQTVDGVWQYSDPSDPHAESDSSSDLQYFDTLSNNPLLLARRLVRSSSRPLSLSASDHVSDRSFSLAASDDPPRAITAVATPTSTATSASTRSNPPSLSSISASAQATHSRGIPTSSSDTLTHATPTATVEPSSTPSVSPDSPTFVNVSQQLGSYFQPSSSAFPAAVMITVAAGILILLMIISVAKCICHKPKFANAKDYPQGFPWDPHHNGAEAVKKSGKRATRAETEYKRMTSRQGSWKSDHSPFDSTRQVAALPQANFRSEGKSFSQLRHSGGSRPPSLVISHTSDAVELREKLATPLSASSGSNLREKSQSSLTNSAFGPGPFSITHDPVEKDLP